MGSTSEMSEPLSKPTRTRKVKVRTAEPASTKAERSGGGAQQWIVELFALSQGGNRDTRESLGKVEVDLYGDHLSIGKIRLASHLAAAGRSADRYTLTSEVLQRGRMPSEEELCGLIKLHQHHR